MLTALEPEETDANFAPSSSIYRRSFLAPASISQRSPLFCLKNSLCRWLGVRRRLTFLCPFFPSVDFMTQLLFLQEGGDVLISLTVFRRLDNLQTTVQSFAVFYTIPKRP